VAHPAHKIKLAKGDLIIAIATGNTFLLVERFKGDQGHYYWKVFPSGGAVKLQMLKWNDGPLKVVRELSIRHNLYGQPKKFKLIRKRLDK